MIQEFEKIEKIEALNVCPRCKSDKFGTVMIAGIKWIFCSNCLFCYKKEESLED